MKHQKKNHEELGAVKRRRLGLGGMVVESSGEKFCFYVCPEGLG